MNNPSWLAIAAVCYAILYTIWVVWNWVYDYRHPEYCRFKHEIMVKIGSKILITLALVVIWYVALCECFKLMD